MNIVACGVVNIVTCGAMNIRTWSPKAAQQTYNEINPPPISL